MKSIFVFLLALVTVTVFPQKGPFQCKWSDNPAGTQGLKYQDYTAFRKGRILVYISNDDSCLYLDLKIPEVPDQNLVLKAGMTVWISVDGKHRKSDGITFPVGIMRRGSGNPGLRDVSTGLIEQAKSIKLTGFGKTGPFFLPASNTNDIRAKVWYVPDGDLVYRLTLPFSKLPGAANRDYRPGDMFALAIEINGEPGNQFRGAPQGDMGQRGGGMPRGGGGGGMRGGMGGGRGRGGAPSFSGAPPSGSFDPKPEVTVWIKDIRLATK